jgi:hypothetical protein
MGSREFLNLRNREAETKTSQLIKSSTLQLNTSISIILIEIHINIRDFRHIFNYITLNK